jgi:Fur family iron response transcriptional regulator
MNPRYTRQEIPEALRNHGVTPTHQRIAIAAALYGRMEHLSADQILACVNEHAAETSKATVYNTLKLFVAQGLVREVIVDPAKVFYDPNPEPHHHLYHLDTGRLTDIPADSISISGLPPLPPGLTTDGVDVIVRVRGARADAA